MFENKKEPLNINRKKKKYLTEIPHKKKQKIIIQKKKESKKLSPLIYYFISIFFAIAVFFLFFYLIDKNSKNILELDNDINFSKEKLLNFSVDKTNLLKKLKNIEKDFINTQKIIEQERAYDKEKSMEYNDVKKIYQNMKEIQNKIIRENDTSIILDKAIDNLKIRLKNNS